MNNIFSVATTSFGAEFPQKTTLMFLDAIEKGQDMAAQIIWSSVKTAFFMWSPWIIGTFFVVAIIAVTKALMGRWGMLGSVLYNSLYLLVLLVIVLIWGPEIFFHDLFNALCTLLLYPFCYLVTGYILDKLGVKSR